MSRLKTEPDWLKAPYIQRLVATLGPEHIRFVGGIVRDTLAERPIKDVDIATTWKPNQVMSKLKAADIKVVPTGLQHGTVTAVIDHVPIEITTLRRDVKTDGRHAEVAFTDDWQSDASRRDFTMNAMYLKMDGTLFDPFEGQKDLKAGRVCFIGDAEERIREDALRMLRFYRFHAGYGHGRVDPEGASAVRTQASLAQGLSVERIRDELLKLLAYRNPVNTMRQMSVSGLVGELPMSGWHVDDLSALIEAEQVVATEPDVFLRLAVLEGRQGCESLGRRLKLSNAESASIKKAALGMALEAPHDEKALRRLLYEEGKMATKAALMVPQSDLAGEYLPHILSWEKPDLPVTGRDLAGVGIAPGIEMGHVLKRLEASWVASDFTYDRETLLAQVDR